MELGVRAAGRREGPGECDCEKVTAEGTSGSGPVGDGVESTSASCQPEEEAMVPLMCLHPPSLDLCPGSVGPLTSQSAGDL